MPNQYLYEIHRYIAEKVAVIRVRQENAVQEGDRDQETFCDGQLQELSAIKHYLADHFNLSTQTYP